MEILMKVLIRFFLIFFLGTALCLAVEEQKAPETKAGKNESKVIIIDENSQKAAGIVVTTIEPKPITTYITAPGEVIPNADSTTKITTRVPAQVIKRDVQEGQHVKENQILATMSSVDMAKVQGNLLLAYQDWVRVKTLGPDAVSGKRYSEAQVNYQNAYSTALAYGMTESEVSQLLKTQKVTQAKGEFNLLAPRSGTAFNINFTEGELVDPGRILLQVVNESSVWIDAKLPPTITQSIQQNTAAKIIAGNRDLMGRVIQVHHQLDETTRTRSIRIEVNNSEDLLHPGQFVNCQIETGQTKPVLSVPENAVLRTADGDLAVYVEKKQNEFEAVEVKVVETINNHSVIEGLQSGMRVVTENAFFIHSEMSKKGFDAHGH